MSEYLLKSIVTYMNISVICGGLRGRSVFGLRGNRSNASRTSSPPTSLPKTVCFSSKCGVSLNVRNHCDPLVSLPLFAMDRVLFVGQFGSSTEGELLPSRIMFGRPLEVIFISEWRAPERLSSRSCARGITGLYLRWMSSQVTHSNTLTPHKVGYQAMENAVIVFSLPCQHQPVVACFRSLLV